MASRSVLHPLLLTPHSNEILNDLERQQRDAMVGAIAARMVGRPAGDERRHTKTTLRPLAWPCYVGGIKATAVITVYYIRQRPRAHEQEQFWFSTLADARQAFPLAQMLDAPSVGPRLRAQA